MAGAGATSLVGVERWNAFVMRELNRSAWLLASAVLVPMLLFLVFQSGFSAREERRSIEAKAQSTADTTIAAADAVLARAIGALDALSTSDSLRIGDIPSAYRRAREVAALNAEWASVELIDARTGTSLFDLRRPLAARPVMAANKAIGTVDLQTVEREGAGCPCVAVERSARGPGAGYVLRVLLSTKPFERLLPPRRAYEVSAIANRDGIFVARSLDQAKRVGRPASTYLRAAVAGGKPSGIYRGITLEGYENYTAFRRSGLSGWTAHVALGSHYIDDPARRFLGSMGAAFLLSLTLAGLLIWFALRQMAQGRRIAERGQQAQKLEALGQLTGGIAHDFNNLLTPIVGALDFLVKRAPLDERGKRIAKGALSSAERAGKLTAQLLAFSRRQKLSVEPVDLPLLMEEIEPLLVQSVGKDHLLDFALDPGATCVRTDLNQLELAVLNLVINARDSSPGGGTIRVVTETAREGAKDIVLIRVVDEGEGMSEEVRRRALEPFFTTKSQGRGSGLGLAQVFGLMEQSGGSVEIETKLGEGTTVTMRLPVCIDPAASRQRETMARKAEPPERVLRLLLVDDDAAVRATLARQLEEHGHNVDSVGDGRIALTAIKYCHYDLVIVDFAMPAMDGAEVIAKARLIRPDQKFLMVTGYADSDAVTAACPDTPVMRKPFDPDLLVGVIADLTR